MKFTLLSDDNRKLSFNMEKINLYVSRWKPHTPFEIEIVKRQPRVSVPMRNHYFGVFLPPVLDKIGYERNEAELFHKQMKIDYFNVKPDKFGVYRDKDIPSVFSDTSDLEVPQKKKFVDWLERELARAGVYTED
jgi:hypothetical protein